MPVSQLDLSDYRTARVRSRHQSLQVEWRVRHLNTLQLEVASSAEESPRHCHCGQSQAAAPTLELESDDFETSKQALATGIVAPRPCCPVGTFDSLNHFQNHADSKASLDLPVDSHQSALRHRLSPHQGNPLQRH